MTASNRLAFGPLFCYSIGNVTLTAIYGYVGAFLLKYYSDHVKLDPAWIGWAFLIRSLIDLVIDPAFGHWSDRVQWRQGRRRPFFLIGTIPAAILFYLMLTPPAGSQFFIFVYLTVTSTLMVWFLSMTGIAHTAMAFEITTDYDERTRIFGYKNLVENATALVVTISVPLALMLDGVTIPGRTLSRADCYCIPAAGLAVLSIIAALIAYFGTTSYSSASQPSEGGFLEGVKDIFRNDAFRVLLIVSVLVTISDRAVSAQFFIVIERYHGLREENCIGLLMANFAGSLVSVLPWVWLAQRYGKEVVLRIAIICWPFACAALVAWQWSTFGLVVANVLMGIFSTGMVTVLGAIIPDVLQFERNRANSRREGMYVSIGSVIYQLAMGLGFFVAGQSLGLIGYDSERPPSPSLITGLRVIFVAIPAVASLGALMAMARFPITRAAYLSRLESLQSPPEDLTVIGGAVASTNQS